MRLWTPPSTESSSALRVSASPRFSYRPMLSRSCSMPMNSQSDSRLETKLIMSLILCLRTRCRTKSRFILSAIALFFSAIYYSFRLYSAYSLFCSFDITLNRISSLISSLRFSAASRLSPYPLIRAISLDANIFRLSSLSLNLWFKSSFSFCFVNLMIKLVSSAFTFSALAFSTTF